jgi:hypothetical protein
MTYSYILYLFNSQFMYVYVHLCVSVCLYVYVHVYVHVYVYVYVYVYVHIYVYSYVYTCKLYEQACICVQASCCAYLHVCIQTYMLHTEADNGESADHIYTHTDIHTCTNTCTDDGDGDGDEDAVDVSRRFSVFLSSSEGLDKHRYVLMSTCMLIHLSACKRHVLQPCLDANMHIHENVSNWSRLGPRHWMNTFLHRQCACRSRWLMKFISCCLHAVAFCPNSSIYTYIPVCTNASAQHSNIE